jgi:hypothetical protein
MNCALLFNELGQTHGLKVVKNSSAYTSTVPSANEMQQLVVGEHLGIHQIHVDSKALPEHE